MSGIFIFNMNTNLFAFMMIYHREYETEMIFDYDLRIFHGEILVTIMIRDQGGLFCLKIIIDSHTMIINKISEKDSVNNKYAVDIR